MAERPVRIQLSRRKGWRIPADTVKVDRTTRWGNPFVVGVDGTQEHCVYLFTMLASGHIALNAKASVKDQKAYIALIQSEIDQLKGKNLACWCRPGLPCHADVLLELAIQ